MAAVQRLPPGMLIGGVAASMLVVAVAAFLLGGGHGGGGGDPTPGPTISIPTSGPGESHGPGATPGPGVTSAPGSGQGGNTQVVDVKNISVTVPADWVVKKQEDTKIWIARPGGGLLILISGKVEDTTTADSWLDDQLANLKTDTTSFEICHERGDSHLFGFATGRTVVACFSTKTQSGEAYSAIDWIAAAVDSSHILYQWEVYSRDDTYDEASDDIIEQAANTVVWKLAPGG
jgi:hypothetical protein